MEKFWKTLLKKVDTRNFEYLRGVKSIVVCANGHTDYKVNISDKHIDSCDVVVRMNDCKIIGDLTGSKTSLQIVTSNAFDLLDCDRVVYLYNRKFLKFKKNVNLPEIDARIVGTQIQNSIKQHFGFTRRMAGLITLLFFAVLKKRFGAENLYIYGFSANLLKDNKIQEYYFDSIEKKGGHLQQHTQHRWDVQCKIISYLKEIDIINEIPKSHQSHIEILRNDETDGSLV